MWIWEQHEWPEFRYDEKVLKTLEDTYLHQSGIFQGTLRHLSQENKTQLIIDLISEEALKTSEIEGEFLNRDSLQSSIRRHFGLHSEQGRILPAEQGISDMMVDLYHHFDQSLSHDTLFSWHRMVMNGRTEIHDIGQYRRQPEPMQVVSGYYNAFKVHYEAPPSKFMMAQMEQFIGWFNKTSPLINIAPPVTSDADISVPSLTRASLAHLYFVLIHPFEDGNGRIGRALSEKCLSQSLGQPALIALSTIIQNKKKAYYDALASSNKDMEITPWIVYFSQTILDAQLYTQDLINFVIEKTKFYDRIKGKMNDRQEKVIARMFKEGPEGFKGGLSAENYIRITGTSRATATRDLQNLHENGVLAREGELKSTRYYLRIGSRG